MDASTVPASSVLSEEDLELVVQRYRREMARYEGAARFVEQRLRRELREAAIPVLLSSRAKHPEDVRGKIRKRQGDPRYTLEHVSKDLNRVMTDVAGCRVIVYDPRQEAVAADVVRRTFALRPDGRSDETLDKDSGYRATHLLVLLGATDVEMSLQGAVCEVQVTSIASHVFNELSHDIDYKEKGVAPGGEVQRQLRDVLNAVRRLDDVVERLASGRAHEIESSKRVIESSEDLRFVFERVLGRPIRGEVEKLHRLLSSVVEPYTAHALIGLDIPAGVQAGRVAAAALNPEFPDADVDDIVAIALGLIAAHDFGRDFRDLASQWRGPSTALKRAILHQAKP